MLAYTQTPNGAGTAVLLLGFPLGFASSAIFSGASAPRWGSARSATRSP
jgi:hypothetical protein